jgi:hypothetical protein
VLPRLGVLLAACAVLAACGGVGELPSAAGTPSGATATLAPSIDLAQLDPCTLIDRDVLSAAVATDLPAGEPQPEVDGQRACLFDAPAASTSVLVMLSRDPAESGGAEERVDQLPTDGRAEELHGVGEAAWFDYCPICPDQAATTLTVIEPPLEFTIALTLPAPDMGRRIILEELARGIIDRLYR